MNDMNPAVVAVGYNRPECMRSLLQSVEAAYYPVQNVTLVVSIDRSDRTDEIEKTAREIGWSHGELRIRTFEQRQGLKKHIIQCGDLSSEYGAVIILEDDLIVSRCFYSYVLQALRFYGDDPRLTGISLYSHAWNGYANYEFIPQRNGYDTYLGQFSISWGQCWTERHWQGFKEWYLEKEKTGLGTNLRLPENIEHWGEKSWGKYFVYYLVEKGLYYVIPYTSLSSNCSEIGEHNSAVSSAHQVMLLDAEDMEYRFPSFEQAIRYDIFFERMFDSGILIDGIRSEDICMDLNGKHRDADGRRYILTSEKQKDLKPVHTYGVRLRPIEENVTAGVEGKDLFLYEVSAAFRKSGVTAYPSPARMQYELYDHNWKRALRFGVRGFAAALQRKMTGARK